MDRYAALSALAAGHLRASFATALGAALMLTAAPVRAQDDGARLYMMTPADTTVASLRLHALESNLAVDPGTVNEGADQHTTLAVLQFVQEFRVGRTQAFVFLVVPGSRIETDAQGAMPASSVTGLGDVQLGFVYGVHGTPSLPVAGYLDHQPGLAVNLLAKLFFPTGEYDGARKANIGANRRAVRLGVPVVYAIGQRMGDPHLMTVELMPTVTFFGANDAPYGATRSKQDPLFIFEGHLTRGFAADFWASLDVLWRRGGEVAVDGVAQDNAQRAISLGVTGTYSLSPSSSLRLSAGKVVDRNAHGPNGWMARVIVGAVF